MNLAKETSYVINFSEKERNALNITAVILSILNEKIYDYDPVLTGIIEDIEELSTKGYCEKTIDREDIEELY